MKWFKHISDSLDDPFIFELMKEFKSDGYLVFFGVLEIYSREYHPEYGWKLVTIPSYFRQKLGISSKKFKKILLKINKWEVEYKDNQVIIFIPKFKELMDDWTKRELRSYSVVTPKILTTDKNKNKDTDKDKEIGKPKRAVFQPPSLNEVSGYCTERGNGIDPQAWMDHYQSNGWLVGKNKMRDWKASVRTWERNSTPKATQISHIKSTWVICPKCKAEVLPSDLEENGCIKCLFYGREND